MTVGLQACEICDLLANLSPVELLNNSEREVHSVIDEVCTLLARLSILGHQLSHLRLQSMLLYRPSVLVTVKL